jgi:hypothetical protein
VYASDCAQEDDRIPIQGFGVGADPVAGGRAKACESTKHKKKNP